ncbi:class I SAM-dependent methyltransferase [Xenorhabdus lircayensis]|uniref:Class I SAM-dependent methyltransferase n=1 Tax=Xenorhabdus lircayensis TaxID=2763499 RepID=A0ABS0UAG6_9GAMM|nr:class I SAM-dependent methyltransferase [Xenorhabdus lircayensis]MBI6549690.1 class I SAM-dependent methyltransferase [Xenorhabdus lircayensis]
MKTNYNLISQDFIKIRQALPERDLAIFELFNDNLPHACKILDICCGHGFPIAKFLSDKGHYILGIDNSENLLAYAKTKLPQHHWVLCDIHDLDIHSQFDGIVMWDAIFHFNREKHPAFLREIYRLLKDDGVFILSSGGSEPDIPEFYDHIFGTEFYYDSLSVSQMKSLLEDIGFTVQYSSMLNPPDGNRDKGRVGFIAKKIN